VNLTRLAFAVLALRSFCSVMAEPTNHAGFPSFQQTSIPTAKGPRFIAVADVNHDGKPDLLVADAGSESGCITVLLGDGKGGFVESKGSPFPAGHLPNDIAVADMTTTTSPFS
jgi:hypothetical protein